MKIKAANAVLLKSIIESGIYVDYIHIDEILNSEKYFYDLSDLFIKLNIQYNDNTVPLDLTDGGIFSTLLFSNKILNEYKHIFDWNQLSKNCYLTEDNIREFSKYVSWPNISSYQQLSEKFIIEFEKNIFWNELSFNYKTILSEKFIEKYLSKLNLNDLTHTQQLSEKFITKYFNCFDWEEDCYILSNQKISLNFISKNMHRINNDALQKIKYNCKISTPEKIKILNYINQNS